MAVITVLVALAYRLLAMPVPSDADSDAAHQANGAEAGRNAPSDKISMKRKFTCVFPPARRQLECPTQIDLEKHRRGYLIASEILKNRDLSIGIDFRRTDIEFDSW